MKGSFGGKGSMKPRIIATSVLILSALCCCAQNSQAPVHPKGAPSALADRSAAASGYVIAPGDGLRVSVWKEPALSGELLVRPDGKISIALLGDVQAAGLTPMELANEISKSMLRFMMDPQVSVVVSTIHQDSVYLLGEVGKKGAINLTPGMTLLEAISRAGGLTDYAKKSKIYILRRQNGKQERIRLNYKKALKGVSGFNVALMPDDTIVVP